MMKTAEVAIEHVLTGLLALCAFLLPLLSGVHFTESILKSEVLVGVLGLAYLFGVVFDKLADTVLSPIEQRLRLRLASGFWKVNKVRYQPGRPGKDDLGDPFPQDVLEFSLRGEKNARTDWIDSLRSRIRTTRGLAVLGLPAMMGLAIYGMANQSPPPESWQWHPNIAVVLNLLLLFTSVLASEIKALKPIRTDKLAGDKEGQKKQVRQATQRMFVSCSFYALMVINSLITLAVIAARLNGLNPVVIGVVGIVLVAPLWVWYHITGTHISFIYRKLPELMAAEKKAISETQKSWQGK